MSAVEATALSLGGRPNLPASIVGIQSSENELYNSLRKPAAAGGYSPSNLQELADRSTLEAAL